MPRPAIPAGAPWPLAGASVLVALQGLALLGVIVSYLVQILTGSPNDLTTALFGASLGLVAAVVLTSLSRPLLGGRRFARAPVLLLELLAVPVAVGLFQGGKPAVGVPLLVPAVLVLLLLAHPRARAPFETAHS